MGPELGKAVKGAMPLASALIMSLMSPQRDLKETSKSHYIVKNDKMRKNPTGHSLAIH